MLQWAFAGKEDIVSHSTVSHHCSTALRDTASLERRAQGHLQKGATGAHPWRGGEWCGIGVITGSSLRLW
jgi:hypothetical protein